MKKPLLLLAISSSLLACKKDETADKVAATIGQRFDLADQQTAILPTTGGNSLSIKLTKVQDSRCPSGAQCLLAGSAGVDLELTDATATPQIARINLGNYNALPNYSRDSVSVTLNQQKYWLRLLDITPYPSLASSPTKVATLRLRSY